MSSVTSATHVRVTSSLLKRGVWPSLFVLLGIVAPMLLPGDKWIRVAALAMVYIALASGLNVLVGLTGLLDLGYIAFFIVGAYTTAIISTRLLLPQIQDGSLNLLEVLPIVLILAVFFAAIAGTIIGYPTLRARGDYLAIMTLAFGEIVRIIALNSTDLTGGAVGIRNIPPLSFEQGGIITPSVTYYVVFGVVLVLLVALSSVIASPVGRAWVAIREDELVAQSMGIRTRRYKLLAYIVGASVASVIGIFFAHMNQFVNPDSFTLEDNFIVLSLVILGGAGTFWGPIVGAIIWIFFQAIAKDIPFIQAYPEFRIGILALIVIILMIARPGGIVSKRLVLTRASRTHAKPENSSDLYQPAGGVDVSKESDSVLIVSHLNQAFGGLRALEDVSFELRQGEILGLMGPNGAGKSTLLNAISGVSHAVEGSVLFHGRNIEKLEASEISAVGIARTFQTVRLFWEMTVLENLLVGAHRRVAGFVLKFVSPVPWIRRREREAVSEADRVLAFLEIRGCRDQRASALNAEQQRRVEIARALMTQPKVLLLDEPAAGLNETETLELGRIIRKIQQTGIDVVLIEHDMSLLMTVSDRIIVLDHGTLIAQGTPTEVQQNPKVVEAYLGSEV